MFVVSRLNGNVETKGSLGFFARDTRFVSGFAININQRPWQLSADAPTGRLTVDPHLPDWLPRIAVGRLRVGEARVDLVVEGHGDQCEVRADSDTPLEVITRVGD